MSLERFLNKRILAVVAHQDDESLYFGGLLGSLVGLAELSLLSTTAPMAGRPDTYYRMDNFYKVAGLLGCRSVACLNLPDCGAQGDEHRTAALEWGVMKGIAELSANFDLILTHGELGEPNAVYGREGHSAHKATHRGVRRAFSGSIVTCALGAPDYSFEIDYEKDAKRKLLECYAPWWTPASYEFAYFVERYAISG